MFMTHKSVRSAIAMIASLPVAVTLCHAQPGLPTVQGQTGLPNNPSAGRNAITLTGAATRSNSQLTMVPPDFASLKLAPGFLISLSVLDDPDFDGQFRIDQQGDLALPIIGAVHVSDKTATEARQAIEQKLRAGQILIDPQVNLTVVEYTAPEVTIIGEVAAPGRYPLLAPRSLTDVLALAGGLTAAAGNEIEVTQESKDARPIVVHYSRATQSQAVQDTLVKPGDTVQVKRAGIVYVLGGVNRPGGYVMQEDGSLTVLQAIAVANGTTLPASVSKIYLLRRNSDGTAIRIELPLEKMQRGKDADMALRPTDVLYVPISKVKSALTNSQGILAAATSASIYATTIY